ncbi:MAG: ankyrin repeat domain-containing protein [Bdellovibrio sp.]|nr:ankyrin repeat domain-containing protein [Bdellovibrio sp.]
MIIRQVVKTILIFGVMLFCSIHGAQAGIFDRFKNSLRDQSFVRAVMREDFSKAQKRLGQGANVNVLKKNKSALMFSIEKNNLQIFNLILSYNPKLNLQDNAGETAVYKAVKVTNLEMLSLLIARGANSNLRLYSGDSPLALARRMGLSDAVALLQANTLLMPSGNCQFIKESKNAPDKSVNLVFVPSGFNGDMELYRQEVQRIWKIFSNYAVFNDKIDVLNVALALTENNEANNFCNFNCGGIERLLCCDHSIAKNLSKSCMTEDIQTIVVHNSTQYGGAGSFSTNVSTTSIHQAAPKVAVHELGHSLFHLADEYAYGRGTPYSARNCAHEGCKRWQDLIEAGLATCQNDGCADGKFFTDGDTIMKGLSRDFENVNERLACCAYKKSTGEYPNFCRKFISVGKGIDSYCRMEVEEENKTINKQLVFAPIEMEFTKNAQGGWQLFSKRIIQRPATYPLEMVQGNIYGGLKIGIETSSGSKDIRMDDQIEVEYIPSDDVEILQSARIIKIPRAVLKIVVEGLDLFSNQKMIEDQHHEVQIRINDRRVIN